MGIMTNKKYVRVCMSASVLALSMMAVTGGAAQAKLVINPYPNAPAAAPTAELPQQPPAPVRPVKAKVPEAQSAPEDIQSAPPAAPVAVEKAQEQSKAQHDLMPEDLRKPPVVEMPEAMEEAMETVGAGVDTQKFTPAKMSEPVPEFVPAPVPETKTVAEPVSLPEPAGRRVVMILPEGAPSIGLDNVRFVKSSAVRVAPVASAPVDAQDEFAPVALTPAPVGVDAPAASAPVMVSEAPSAEDVAKEEVVMHEEPDARVKSGASVISVDEPQELVVSSRYLSQDMSSARDVPPVVADMGEPEYLDSAEQMMNPPMPVPVQPEETAVTEQPVSDEKTETSPVPAIDTVIAGYTEEELKVPPSMNAHGTPPQEPRSLAENLNEKGLVVMDLRRQASPAPAPAPVSSSAPVPLLAKAVPNSWQVLEGADLYETLSLWARDAGVEIVWQTEKEFSVSRAVALSGDFAAAVSAVLDTYDGQALRPYGDLYADPQSGKMTLVIHSEP